MAKTGKKTKKSQVIFDRQKQKAKPKQGSKVQRFKGSKTVKPWLENKIKAARKLSEHRAARAAARFGGPAGVVLVILFALTSLLLPKNEFQKAKEQLAKNPNDFEVHLVLAEKFLENNQFEKAGQILRLARAIKQSSPDKVEDPRSKDRDYQAIKSRQGRGSSIKRSGLSSNQILGQEANVKLEELWERKIYSDPEGIKRLIAAWEEILQEKPDYRDGYLQLSRLYYKIYEDEKAKENLKKALELDPNFEPARELEKVIK